MKNLIKTLTLFAATALVLTGCDCFKKMAKDSSVVKISATPEVLQLNNGKISVDIKAEIPAKYFDKTASLRVTPAIVYDGGIVEGESVLLQGDKVLTNGIAVSNGTTTSISRNVVFNYLPEMDKCELKLLVEVKCKSGKCKTYTFVNANTGALINDYGKQALAKGGDSAYAVKNSFGLTVAKGVNTLQKDLNYVGAMQAEQNNYKNVTTTVVKADILYKISSAEVGNKAVKTKQLDNLKANVDANNANDRASQSVYVNGYASPDGPEKFNDRLSQKRSQSGLTAVKKLLKDSGLNIDAAAYGEDWEGFQEAVAASNIEDKDLILQVLKMYSSSAEREQEIKNMSSVFKTLKTDVLPQLRRAQVVNSADITGKTDAEMIALIKAGKASELDVEELLYIATVDADVAHTALEQAAKRYNDARAYNNLAILYAQSGDYNEALSALNNAVKAGDRSTEVSNNYAMLYLAKGDTAKAVEYAKGGTTETKALVAAAQGDYALASKELSGYNAAIAQVQSGNLAAAKKSIAGDNSAKADYLRAVISVKEGNLNEAKAQLNSAVSKDSSLALKAAKDINLEAICK